MVPNVRNAESSSQPQKILKRACESSPGKLLDTAMILLHIILQMKVDIYLRFLESSQPILQPSGAQLFGNSCRRLHVSSNIYSFIPVHFRDMKKLDLPI